MIILHRLAAHHFKQLQDVDLQLPDSGSILIEGHNEAGKSSLFEAIFFALFGRPLLGERDYSISDMKRYGADSMEVTLDFSIGGRAFSVARRVGKNHTAKLIAPGENGEETVSGLNEIRRRLNDEMRLSADALLNTCFVEQKRLERLEDMNREARRDAINELLNLKVLTDLEAHFKVTRETRDTFEWQKQRVDLARLDAELPQLEQAVQEAEYSWNAARFRKAQQQVDKLLQQIEDAQQEQSGIKARREQLAQEIERGARIAARLQSVEGELYWRAKAWCDAENDREAFGQRVADLKHRAQELPERIGQLEEHKRLAAMLSDLEVRQRKADEVQSYVQHREQLTAQREAVGDPLEFQLQVQKVASRLKLTMGFAAVFTVLALLLQGVIGLAFSIAFAVLVLIAAVFFMLRWLGELNAVKEQHLQAQRQQASLEGEQRALEAKRSASLQGKTDMEVTLLLQEYSAVSHELEMVRQELGRRNLPRESGKLQTALALREAEIQRESESIMHLQSLDADVLQKTELVRSTQDEFIAAWKNVAGEQSAPTSPEEALQQVNNLRASLHRDMTNLDVSSLQSQDVELQTEYTMLDRKIAAWQHERELQVKLLNALPPLQTDDTYFDQQKTVVEFEAELDAARSDLIHHRAHRRAAAQSLGVEDGVLNLEAEATMLTQLQRDLAVKRRASEVVSKTRSNIVSRVMPLTIANVRRVLPLLTEGRYRDVQWDEENNTLAVYDSLAHDFVRKRVFSGGARDQISLALRLAFALATLPGEHNIRPGFLFLDEPLSSFDRVRTQALVELLTRGLIRQSFQQIFLVSHSQSFEPGLFDFQLRMESGRVAESTLP